MEIVPVQPVHYDQILEIYTPYILKTPITFEIDVPSKESFHQRIENTKANYPYLVALVDNKVVGYAYAGLYRARKAYCKSVELSIYMDETFKGQGIGYQLYQKLLEELKDRGFHMAYSCITYPNKPSIALHEKFGFDMIGIFHESGYKFDTWYDVCWMEKKLSDS